MSSWSWSPVWVVVLVLAVVAGPLVGAAGYRLGSRRAGREMPANSRQRWKDRALFSAALVAGAAVYAAVVVGSFNGLTAFARHQLGWGGQDGQGWRQYIVPVTLDGVAAAFAFLAGRSVLRRRSPVRCYLMVWGATGASAAANFAEGEGSHGAAAGVYLAFLSVAGIAIFHTFLDQLAHSGPEYVRRRYPPFGLRWVTATPSTVLAALAWINYPPEGVEPTVPAALAHLDEVRAAKRQRRRERMAQREADRREAITTRAERAALVERARAAGRRADPGDPAPAVATAPAGGVAETVVPGGETVGESVKTASPHGFTPFNVPTGTPVMPAARPRMPARTSASRASGPAGASGSSAAAPRLDMAADAGEDGSWGRGRARLEQLLAERVPPARVPHLGEGDRLPGEFASLVGDLAGQAGLTRKAALKYARAWALAQPNGPRLLPAPAGRGR